MTDSRTSKDLLSKLRSYHPTSGYARYMRQAADTIEQLERDLLAALEQRNQEVRLRQAAEKAALARAAHEPPAVRCDHDPMSHGSTLECDERGALKCSNCTTLDAPTQPPGPSPLALHAYAMTERHLSGYRLILGFDTLTKVQAAHKEVCDLAVLARDALTKESAP